MMQAKTTTELQLTKTQTVMVPKDITIPQTTITIRAHANHFPHIKTTGVIYKHAHINIQKCTKR